MKLYSAPYPAPNPRRVLIFLAEKGMSIPVIDLSLMKGEHKSADFVAKNSRAQIPVLELDDGTTISESISICRYLDDLHPNPPLFGTEPLERAIIDMWVRRIEFNVMAPVGLFWAHAHPYTARVVNQHKDFGESNRGRWEAAACWLDSELARQDFVAGSRFTIADIAALTTIDFAIWIGLSIPSNCASLLAWHTKLSQRESIKGLSPGAP
jgi:glutathione S-transferase